MDINQLVAKVWLCQMSMSVGGITTIIRQHHPGVIFVGRIK